MEDLIGLVGAVAIIRSQAATSSDVERGNAIQRVAV